MAARALAVPMAAFIAGIGPWILINAVFVQLEALVRLVGPSIASVLAVFVQVGTLAALAYTAWPPRWLPEWLLISLTMMLNVAGGLAVCLAWDKMLIILHHPRLFFVIFAMTAGGCSGALSIVQLYPLAARGSRSCTAALSAGMGANGIFASLLGLALVNPTHYFIAITALILLSLIAAVVLVILLPPAASSASPDDSVVPLVTNADEISTKSLSDRFIGWQVASLQLAIACLNYSLVSLVPYALPTLLRVASLVAPALGSISRLFIAFLPIRRHSFLFLPSIVLCFIWLGLFFAAVRPPATATERALALAALFAFNVIYSLSDTLIFLLAGLVPSHLRESAVRLAGAGQQTGAGIGSLMGLLFATLWPSAW